MKMNSQPELVSVSNIAFIVFVLACLTVTDIVFIRILRVNVKMVVRAKRRGEPNETLLSNLEAFNKKYSILIDGLDIRGSKYNFYYIPVFILRRLVYTVLTFSLVDFPYLQTQLLIFFSSVYMIYYISFHPHRLPYRFR